MKRSLYLVTLVLLSIPSFLYAQKDAPVAGHAATLTDLLKKDYSATDPEQRETDISRDRTQVIAIFKSYLTDPQQASLKSKLFNTSANELKACLDSVNMKKKELDIYMAEHEKDLNTLNKAVSVTQELEGIKRRYNARKTEVDLLELDAISNQYSDNAFLVKAIKQFADKYTSLNTNEIDLFATSNTVSSVQKSIPFIGGALTFETVIDGLGRFLAKRIKEELTTYVLDRIKIWLQNPDENDPLTEFKVLLPKTTSFLIGFNADQITNFPNEIKQYIEDDLNHLLDNAANLRNTPRIGKLLSRYPDLDFAFEALELIPDISKIKNPVDYFTFLETSRNISRWKKEKESKIRYNIANGVYLTALLSRSLVVIDNGEKRFASTEFLTTYAQESIFFILYSGFLHQQNLKYYDIAFINNDKDPVLLKSLFKQKVLDYVDDMEANRIFFTDLITQSAKNAEKVFTLAADIRKANKAGIKPGADTVYAFIKSIISFSEETTGAADKLINYLDDTDKATERIEISQLTKPYFTIANTTNDVIYDIQRKKYTTALIKALEISAPLLQNNQLTLVSNFVKSVDNSRFNLSVYDWALVAPAIIKGHVNTTMKEAIPRFNIELDKVKNYYTRNYKDPQIFNGPIDVFKTLCLEAYTSGSMTAANLQKTQELLNTPDFIKVVVSYYSQNLLQEKLDSIKSELVSIRIKRASDTTEPLFTVKEATQITESIKAYSLAICTNYFILGLKEEGKELQEKRRALTDALRVYALKLPEKLDLQLNPRLISLIHFVNDMAVAQDAEGVEKAIEAFALPAGSYAIKRKAAKNFSLNSYPGIMAAYEITPSENKSAMSVGFTAPIGISMSWGIGCGYSLGGFLSVIDIGAVTRLRLNSSDSTRALPEFNFKNILAPGLHVSLGFPKTPFSINLGIQYGPELRVLQSDNSYKSFDSYRIGIGAVLDIPLLNLHTKLRK
ncbi:hypothetical protein GFS24_13425 [Chitinophaga sp. SYP-B3965]|uniref:hypothetical protein n=1 Tax=Chitinophaga sp. SYP-B3965 TaxID=2663120 RepID=UPI001299EEFE|nr:hypothetical protein [Chitinophaga sp. SYP-B3965]MRG46124.1 hypothetical protein [Chitinophaga sp. SYP-B3965]